MSDADTKSKLFGLPFLIGAGVIVIAILAAGYMVWKQLSSLSISNAEKSKSINEINTKLGKVETELKAKDEKVSNLVQEVSELKGKVLLSERDIKDIKKNAKQVKTVGTKQKTKPNNKVECTEDSCVMGSFSEEEND